MESVRNEGPRGRVWGEGVPSPPWDVSGEGAMPAPQKNRFLSSKWQVLVHSGS